MIVFRETRELVEARSAIEHLRKSLSRAGAEEPRALFAAAELECALADIDHPLAGQVARITDTAADCWLRRDGAGADPIRPLVDELHLPARLERRIPEGFAYYALSPESYVELARAHAVAKRPALVIGIRSIGVSLSAAVAAELRRRGTDVVRCTVRPQGHPWARHLSLPPDVLSYLGQNPEADALVVDEGPGLSGSTFLAVGEALLGAGMPKERIVFFCSHAFDPNQLRAEDARVRFARFEIRAAPDWRPPPGTRSFAAGAWRALRFTNAASYPACWSNLERVKYRTSEGTLVKFEGFGGYGDQSFRRASVISEGGWSPRVRRFAPGYFGYEWIEGRAPAPRDLAWLLPRLAEYLAFRTLTLAHPGSDPEPLQQMLRVNVAEACGIELPASVRLEVVQPIEPDARLAPHEWVIQQDGTLFKTDSADHAGDHLLPGPADVAWDLAGVIIEWGLGRAARRSLLESYRSISGDDAGSRLAAYLAAYAAFRVGYAAMAGGASARAERARWGIRERAYRRCLRRALSELGFETPRPARAR